MKKNIVWDFCCGGEDGGTKEKEQRHEDVWGKKQKDAVSDAKEILGNWSGKNKNVQLIRDSQMSREDRNLLLCKLKVESQPKRHEQTSKELTQL